MNIKVVSSMVQYFFDKKIAGTAVDKSATKRKKALNKQSAKELH